MDPTTVVPNTTLVRTRADARQESDVMAEYGSQPVATTPRSVDVGRGREHEAVQPPVPPPGSGLNI